MGIKNAAGINFKKTYLLHYAVFVVKNNCFNWIWYRISKNNLVDGTPVSVVASKELTTLPKCNPNDNENHNCAQTTST